MRALLRRSLPGPVPRSGPRPPAARNRLDGPVAAALGPSRDRTVVVLAHRDHPRALRRWLDTLAGDDVTVLRLRGPRRSTPPGDTAATPPPVAVDLGDGADLTRHLAELGPVDVIVVAVPGHKLGAAAAHHFALLPQVFFHLRPGGVLVLDRTVGKDPDAALAPEHWHRLLVAEPAGDPTGEPADEAGTGAAQVPDDEDGPDRWTRDLAEATRELLLTRRHVVVTKRHHHLYKLHERGVEQVLARREPGLQVTRLAVLPPSVLAAPSAEQMYGPTDLEPLPAPLSTPELVLRHYQGEVWSQRASVLHASHTMLPESFRWPWTERLTHPRTDAVSAEFVERPPRPGRALDGDFFFLDCLFPGHFGHLLTEVVSRLWGWEIAKRELPGLKALFHGRVFEGQRGELERQLFGAYGIAPQDLVWSRRPVRLSSLVGAAPMWHNRDPFFAHPDIAGVWERLTSGLLAGHPPGDDERVFVSRGSDLKHRRGCHNQDELERRFADRGFRVFYPEQHSLAEQVAVFAGAKVVAGFAGSAMFNLMHARRLEAVVVLSHSGYVHRNEQLFARMHRATLHHFWSPHDPVPLDADAQTVARASWSFDFAGLGDDLDRVLREL